MWETLKEAFDSSGFMPHGHCYFWDPGVLWLNVGSDALIAMAYYSIPFTLFYFVSKRNDLKYKWIFNLFMIFIFACGTTHLVDIVTVWNPQYWLEGWVKFLTAGVSIATAILLIFLVPRALLLPSIGQWEQANRQLKTEIKQKEEAEEKLAKSNISLEKRVKERTEEISKINEDLQREINERRNYEERLKKQNAELERVNADMDNFVYAASHDLKSPVLNIESLVTALREDINPEQADVKEILERLDTSVNRMKNTIGDLSEVAKATKTTESQEVSKLHFSEITSEVLKDIEESIKSSEAEIHTDFSNCDEISYSRYNLRTIIYNLVINAIKYRSPDRKPVIQIKSHTCDDDTVLFEVRDNGLGMDLERHGDKMFRLFKRLHDHVEGTGIGLYIIKKIIESNGGRIEVESEEGKGTTFKVYLRQA